MAAAIFSCAATSHAADAVFPAPSNLHFVTDDRLVCGYWDKNIPRETAYNCMAEFKRGQIALAYDWQSKCTQNCSPIKAFFVIQNGKVVDTVTLGPLPELPPDLVKAGFPDPRRLFSNGLITETYVAKAGTFVAGDCFSVRAESLSGSTATSGTACIKQAPATPSP